MTREYRRALMRMRPPVPLLALALLATFVVPAWLSQQNAAAEEPKRPVAVMFALDRPLDGSVAPLALAAGRGLFGAEGVTVTITTAKGSPDAIARVASGESDIALADINELIRYRDSAGSQPVKAVFVLFNKAPYAIIARKSRGIQALTDVEGKTLGVDRGDEMIRDRVAFKLQYLIFDQVRVPQPNDEQLRAWFSDNHARFDEPERVSFFMTPPSDEATARRYLDDIREQRESEELRDQTRAVLDRPVPSLAAGFGDGFSDGLLKAPLQEWTLLQSKDGWHVVRLDARMPGAPAKLEDIRAEAAKIWHTEETRKRAWEAVSRLKANYTIRYEP